MLYIWRHLACSANKSEFSAKKWYDKDLAKLCNFALVIDCIIESWPRKRQFVFRLLQPVQNELGPRIIVGVRLQQWRRNVGLPLFTSRYLMPVNCVIWTVGPDVHGEVFSARDYMTTVRSWLSLMNESEQSPGQATFLLCAGAGDTERMEPETKKRTCLTCYASSKPVMQIHRSCGRVARWMPWNFWWWCWTAAWGNWDWVALPRARDVHGVRERLQQIYLSFERSGERRKSSVRSSADECVREVMFWYLSNGGDQQPVQASRCNCSCGQYRGHCPRYRLSPKVTDFYSRSYELVQLEQVPAPGANF